MLEVSSVRFRERLQWISRMALLLFILASVAFLSALVAMRFAIQGRDVSMPDVVGKSVTQAQQILQSSHLDIRVEDRVYDKLPLDAVVRQSPQAKTLVKTGQNAHVVLSLGPQNATIPALREQSLRAAQIELLRAGMQLGEVTSVHLPGSALAEDVILQQDPVAGASQMTSPHVNLLVSLGSPESSYVMPELSGLPLADAESKLAEAGLRTPKIALVTATSVSRATVVTETPARGQRVDSQTPIVLQVAE
jgi:eukaryotic-like serine/threonine-protein kinase